MRVKNLPGKDIYSTGFLILVAWVAVSKSRASKRGSHVLASRMAVSCSLLYTTEVVFLVNISQTMKRFLRPDFLRQNNEWNKIRLGGRDWGSSKGGQLNFWNSPFFLSLKHLRPRRLKGPWCRTLPRTWDDRHEQNDLYLKKDHSVIVGHCGVNHCESFFWHNVTECKTFLVLVTSNLQMLLWVQKKVYD